MQVAMVAEQGKQFQVTWSAPSMGSPGIYTVTHRGGVVISGRLTRWARADRDAVIAFVTPMIRRQLIIAQVAARPVELALEQGWAQLRSKYPEGVPLRLVWRLHRTHGVGFLRALVGTLRAVRQT